MNRNREQIVAALQNIQANNNGILKQALNLGLYKPRSSDSNFPSLISIITERLVQHCSSEVDVKPCILRVSKKETSENIILMDFIESDLHIEFENTKLLDSIMNIVIAITEPHNVAGMYKGVVIKDRIISEIITFSNIGDTFNDMKKDFNEYVISGSTRKTKCLMVREKVDLVSLQWRLRHKYLKGC